MVCKNYYAHDFVFMPVNSGTALLNRWMLHLKVDVRPAATGLDRPETPKKGPARCELVLGLMERQRQHI